MKYTVEFKKTALKEFNKLPLKMQDKILEVAEFLKVNPYSEVLQTKKIKGHDRLYRVRIGDYRMVYEVLNEVLVIYVIKIGHRKEVYRKDF